jgi:hypothetical protein
MTHDICRIEALIHDIKERGYGNADDVITGWNELHGHNNRPEWLARIVQPKWPVAQERSERPVVSKRPDLAEQPVLPTPMEVFAQ